MSAEAKSGRARISRKGIVKLVKEVRGELKKVIWPNREQLINNTITVLIACLVIGAIIWTADSILSRLVDFTIPS